MKMAESMSSFGRRGSIQLNKSTDYAIRILLYLGTKRKLCNTGDIAKAMKIPEREAARLLKIMASQGILTGLKGKKGGYMISRELERITLYDVIAMTTKELKINACLRDRHECSRDVTESCKVRRCFEDLQILVEMRLQSITLDQFI